MSDEEPVDDIGAASAAGAAGTGPEAQVADLQERLLRSQAELENFRKRSRREYDDAQRYREIDVLRDLLQSIYSIHLHKMLELAYTFPRRI